ncbi:hypothetical protein VB264_06945 [Arcicella aquatica]|uniref:Uracil DNA glycosylase superfamily protein n=1 Tax=Arcicella aquatica TaxID=217141 RepID=A0ABU5QKC9_9BACT|nr:hypothetical protein [Arcicella aquatica]MEA5257512.1 hypothetical protein [Arcicella aquatica]
MNKIFDERLSILYLEIRALKTYEERLNKWAEFTVDYCDNVAKTKIDRSFYAFQSEPKHEPDILILGLNPYGVYNYENQFSNEGWGVKQYGKMIPDVFIHQNPWYIGGKEADKIENGKKKKEWNILRNLNKTINIHPEFRKCFDNMVYMNILFFNSKDFSEFKKSFKNEWLEVFDNCVKLSLLLICEVIKPKVILCLGVNHCFRPFIGRNKTEEMLPKSLYKSTIDGFRIYGMTHPSARISNFKREEIGRCLFKEWLNISTSPI